MFGFQERTRTRDPICDPRQKRCEKRFADLFCDLHDLILRFAARQCVQRPLNLGVYMILANE